MENRHDLVVDCRVTLADGYGERDAAQGRLKVCPRSPWRDCQHGVLLRRRLRQRSAEVAALHARNSRHRKR